MDDSFKIEPLDKQELEGKRVLLKPEFFRGPPAHRVFLCVGGFGCHPWAHGTAVMGQFVIDGEKTRVERYQIEGVLLEQEHH